MSTRQRRGRQAQGDIQDPSITSTVDLLYFPILDPVHIYRTPSNGDTRPFPSTYLSFVFAL